MQSLRWRRDIQGLRAVAVLAVVLYHARFAFWPGGFVGVDVFLVISGYLITGLLVRETLRTGRIDLIAFYIRRLRRLTPALAVMVVTTIVACFFIFAPVVQTRLAESAAYASTYLSNFLFSAKATDYLAADADHNPFLHTWSLAVEEQFYLVWPLLIMLLAGVLRRRRPKAAFILVVLALASFFACVVFTYRGLNYYSFFMLPFRAWEFILGGLVFVAGQAQQPRLPVSSRSVSAASVFGVGLIAGAIFGLDETTAYPGFATLLPVVGTALVIWAGQARPEHAQPGPNRLLSTAPFVRIGAVSYSWYLWHWPVFVLGFKLWPNANTAVVFAFIAVSYGLAELSYRFVERGYRARRHRRATLLGLVRAGSVVLFAGCASVAWWLGSQYVNERGFLKPYRVAADDVPMVYTRSGDHGNACHVEITSTTLANCVDGDRPYRREVVLLGDSRAAQWAPALAQIAKARQWRLHYVTKAACGALPLPTYFYRKLDRLLVECSEWTPKAYAKIKQIKPSLIIFSNSINNKYTLEQWRRGLQELPAALDMQQNNSRLLVLGDVARPGFDVPACLSRYAWNRRFLGWLGRPLDDCSFANTQGFRDRVLAAWQRVAASTPDMKYLQVNTLVCRSSRCSAVDDRTANVKYRDSNHLTTAYVDQLTPGLARRLDAVIDENPSVADGQSPRAPVRTN